MDDHQYSFVVLENLQRPLVQLQHPVLCLLWFYNAHLNAMEKYEYFHEFGTAELYAMAHGIDVYVVSQQVTEASIGRGCAYRDATFKIVAWSGCEEPDPEQRFRDETTARIGYAEHEPALWRCISTPSRLCGLYRELGVIVNASDE